MPAAVERLFTELFEAAAAGRRASEEFAYQAGQTLSRSQVLWMINVGGLTVPQIARRLGVTRQNVQRVVAELEAADLAAPHPNPDHRTSPLLALTPEGSKVLARVNSAAEEMHHGLLRHFSLAQVEQLSELLAEYLEAMNRYESERAAPPRS